MEREKVDNHKRNSGDGIMNDDNNECTSRNTHCSSSSDMKDNEDGSNSQFHRQSAHCHNLCFRLAVTFSNYSMLRHFCISELNLSHWTEFMVL
jgi:E3 ubiquitin-protein ligase DOA10